VYVTETGYLIQQSRQARHQLRLAIEELVRVRTQLRATRKAMDDRRLESSTDVDSPSARQRLRFSVFRSHQPGDV